MIARYGALALTALASCAAPLPSPSPRAPADAARGALAELELVPSTPIETTLGAVDLRDAVLVWPEMIDRATRRVSFAHMYASDTDEGESPLAPTLAAVERALARGVEIRFLADASFATIYPVTLERLRRAGALVRTFDASARYGGVQHAKYFVVDGEESFVGSQNFDWRALAHIHEVGVRVRSTEIASGLLDLFETDWSLADAANADEARPRRRAPEAEARTGEKVSVYASPKGWLPDESRWELPRLISLIDGAARSVAVQVLYHSTTTRDGRSFTALDDAIRRAGARGVRVRLLVSHWGAKPETDARQTIEALSSVPNVEVRVLTVPPWSGGEISFARVAHAKYMSVDGRAAWIGTSNWRGDYFLRSRNVGLVLEGGPLVARLERLFEGAWASAYASALDRTVTGPPASAPGGGSPPSGSDPARP